MKAFGKAFNELMAWDIESRRGVVNTGTGWKAEFTEFDHSINGQVIFEENDVTISAFPAVHCFEGPVSYRLDWNGLSFVWTGDGRPDELTAKYAKDVDVFVTECEIDTGALPGPIQEAFFNLIRSFWEHGALDGQIREMIRMRPAMKPNASCKKRKGRSGPRSTFS